MNVVDAPFLLVHAVERVKHHAIEIDPFRAEDDRLKIVLTADAVDDPVEDDVFLEIAATIKVALNPDVCGAGRFKRFRDLQLIEIKGAAPISRECERRSEPAAVVVYAVEEEPDGVVEGNGLLTKLLSVESNLAIEEVAFVVGLPWVRPFDVEEDALRGKIPSGPILVAVQGDRELFEIDDLVDSPCDARCD